MNNVMKNQLELQQAYFELVAEKDPSLATKILKVAELLKEQNYTAIVKMADEQVYHHGVGLSRSALVDAKKTPFNYYKKHLDRYKPKKATTPMTLGDMVHKALLEPEILAETYCSDATIMKELSHYSSPRNTKAYKAFRADVEGSGQTLVNQDLYAAMHAMVDRVWSNKAARDLLKAGVHERAAYAVDPTTGLLCRVKPDSFIMDDRRIIDFKTTNSDGMEDFGKKAYNEGYHFQVGIYTKVMEWVTSVVWEKFTFIVVENEYPYEVSVQTMDEGSLDLGQRWVQREMARLATCFEKKVFYSYPQEDMSLSLPHYAFQEMEGLYE